jgi:hypothetical protein
MLRPRDATLGSRLRYPARLDFWSAPPSVNPAANTASVKSPIGSGLPAALIASMAVSTSCLARDPAGGRTRPKFLPCSRSVFGVPPPSAGATYRSRVRKNACRSSASASAFANASRALAAVDRARCRSAVARATMSSVFGIQLLLTDTAVPNTVSAGKSQGHSAVSDKKGSQQNIDRPSASRPLDIKGFFDRVVWECPMPTRTCPCQKARLPPRRVSGWHVLNHDGGDRRLSADAGGADRGIGHNAGSVRIGPVGLGWLGYVLHKCLSVQTTTGWPQIPLEAGVRRQGSPPPAAPH